MKYRQCEWCLKNVGTINIWANTGLAVLKLAGGILSRSQALLADAIHSLSDTLIAVVLYVTLKISGKPPDRNYHYGRGTIEYITLGIISIFIIVVAIAVFVSSLKAMLADNIPQVSSIGILVALVSITGNQLLSSHSFCVAKEANSPAIFANALENRADVYTSAAALIGVAGSRLGFRIMDPLAALFVGVLIAKFGISMLYRAINSLLGESLDKSKLEKINRIAASVPGVQKIYDIKARKSGQKSIVDLEIGIEPDTKLGETTRICELIKSNILRELHNIGGVSVYLK
ncbi:cation diffusion facilitator family transporter [candidate division KSB1 bacterium]